MSNEQNNTPVYADDEITLKELIQKLQEFWRELWGKKWWILLVTIPFIVYFGYKAKTTKITYNAQLTYLLNDGGGGGGALSGILGSFGLGKGGKVNLDRIVELSRSRNIIQKVLFTKIPLDSLDGKVDYIANHIITIYELDKQWSKNDKDFTNFRFTNDSILNFGSKNLIALKAVYSKMVGSTNILPIFTNSFNEDTGILTISANTLNEELSLNISKLAYSELKEYYVNSLIKGSQSTFNYVQAKTDSIFGLLKTKEFQLSRFNDSHRNLVDPGLLTQKRLLETEILKLKTMYGEVTKNRELADFSLETGTPDITIIDEPLPPLQPQGMSLLIELIKGALLGGLLSAALFIARKIVRDALA